jgi:3-methyladenine DNA glycosylase AlkC
LARFRVSGGRQPAGPENVGPALDRRKAVEQVFQLRDVFNPTVVNQLADRIAASWPAFDRDGFAAAVNEQMPPLNFGARSNLIRDTLWAYLPQDFPQAVQILLDALGPEIPHCELSGLDGFTVMSLNDFVAKYGIDHFDLSMHALYEMTKRFTAEGAIRAFLKKYPGQTLAVLEGWASDPNCHVRRLVSEGTRPRLPLAPRLDQFVKDPRPVLRLLDKLKNDPERMVQRSVANNLNDIAKDNPTAVVETLSAWKSDPSLGVRWIMGQASRTLVKQGQKEALALLGYPAEIDIEVQSLRVQSPIVRLGEALVFDFEVCAQSDQPQNLMIDFIIHHVKANGRRSPKVFKLTQKRLEPGQRLAITKRHPMRPISTRVYYPGTHLLEIQINGQVWAQAPFELQV